METLAIPKKDKRKHRRQAGGRKTREGKEVKRSNKASKKGIAKESRAASADTHQRAVLSQL